MEEIKRHNKVFVASGAGKAFEASKYPSKKIAIVTCMDTRLVTMLPAALGIKNGDVKMIKNAGGLVTEPYSDSMRSILVAVYELGVDHVMIIAHTNCGVEGMKGEEFLHEMEKKGISHDAIEHIKSTGVDLERWLSGFTDSKEAVKESISLVKNHPLLPLDIKVTGHIIDTITGELIDVALNT